MENVKPVVKPDISRLLKEISRILAVKDIPTYIVGGFVRDILLGRETADIDIAIGGNATIIAPEIAAAIKGKYIELDDINRIGRIILPDKKHQLDFTTLRGNIREDLARRDFTIDAMALELGKGTADKIDTADIIDPFQGQEDLRHRTLKAVSETVFKEDAARLLRALRIAAELDFSIDEATEIQILHDSRLIASVSGERTREELLRLLALPGAGPRLLYMDKLGLLTALVPELEASRGVNQPWIHVWDVFEHSIRTVAAVEAVLRESAWEYAGQDAIEYVPWSEKLSGHFDREISSGSTGRTMLKLAALFHDIAKPQTKTLDDDGRARFIGHPVEGAKTAANILERLRFSNREIQLVELLVKYHLRPTQMSNEGLPTDRAIYRFFRDTGEAGIDLLFLCLADHLATRGDTLEMSGWREHTQMTEHVLARYFQEAVVSKPPKLIDGNDIMKILGISPGPEVGELLEALHEAQAAGEVKNTQEAVQYTKNLFLTSPPDINRKSTRREK
jgi:poly(A) polymerase